MGNIVTPEQGLLPLPDHDNVLSFVYPWWLNTALAIWALAALLCCWLLLLLYLLRYCCRWCRHRKYGTDRLSLKQRLFMGNDHRGSYTGNDRSFATLPTLTPIPHYIVNDSNEVIFDDIYESRSIREDQYADGTSAYVTSTFGGTENEMFESSSELISEEEITNRQLRKKSAIIHTLPNRNDLPVTTSTRLPGPTITTVHMAAERITDNPNWENANPRDDSKKDGLEKAASKIVSENVGIFNSDVTYAEQPDIYIHQPLSPIKIRAESRQIAKHIVPSLDDASLTSEMSGHDSETIYQTVRIFPPNHQPLDNMDEDEYRTAGVDEVQIEMKDLVQMQRTISATNETNSKISLYPHIYQENQRPRELSISSASKQDHVIQPTLAYNAMQHPSIEQIDHDEATQTIQTCYIQSICQQAEQQLQRSVFPSTKSTASILNQGQNNTQQHTHSNNTINYFL